MTKWTFKKKAKSVDFFTFKTEDGQPEVLIGEMAKGLHISMAEVASFFKPGDLIVTPTGSCIMLEQMGEGNN